MAELDRFVRAERYRALDGVANAARMREQGPLHAKLEVVAQRLLGARPELVLLVAHHHFRDQDQLVYGVVGEVDVVGDA